MLSLSNWLLGPASRLVIAFALTLGMLLSPIGSSASHLLEKLAAAEQAPHTESAAQTDTHSHTLDLDDDEHVEQSPGHSYDHNPLDHTHETASTIPTSFSSISPVERIWSVHTTVFADPGTCFRLERPPKPIFHA